ncbi:MAG: PTS transporter subunit EIIC [Epulopiscium sp.]|nr:PTS transporter subunit EIIC [Candidatus Epulonipiscium sp.]
MNKVLGKLQRLGKALMLPIAVLPIAGLLLRLGQPDVFNIPFIANAGDAIFGNLPLIFAIGVAVGLSDDGDGAAALAGAVGYLIMIGVTETIDPDIDLQALGGIIAGVIGGLAYNKYSGTKLPDFLGFFGGRRFVPIVTGLFSMITGIVFGYVWPPIQNVIDIFANWMMNSGGVGEFSFGLFNRLLIPTGLHHVLNNMAWFTFGKFNGASGDLGRFFAQVPAEGLMDPSAGIFMTGFFPIMMFGLPAAAFAMYVCAKKENKAVVGGALFSVAFTAFLTGITEPIEFMFMFLAPTLYLIHAILTGAVLALTSLMGIRHGFSFSAGAIDYFLNMGLATKGWLLIPIGLVVAVVYFLLFVFFIKKFDIKTPGREDDEEATGVKEAIANQGVAEVAAAYLEKLGGIDNLKSIDSCITRLRLTVYDPEIIKDSDMKALGASGVIRPSKNTVQVIVGTSADLIAREMKKLSK